MTKNEVCAFIKEMGIIPAIRVHSDEDAHFAAETIIQGGIPIVEITMTVPGAVGLISHLVRYHPKLVVGAGTVLDMETARQCVDAGASFLTATGFEVELVEFARKEDVTVLPGALTPTEVIKAWKAGSDFVKVFPCSGVGGDRYIKSLKAALPQIQLIAAGGVNQQTAANFILAGATAIGVGAELIPPEAIALRQPKRIRELARRFKGFVKEARDRVHEAEQNAVVQKSSSIAKCEGQ
jgi:2-dehydro-3-deoxyphosphogluconate aldolase/(4S)-4-hydroxy-2-oxoglutarate aldolase